ncbi:catechol-2,3-dioxygenase [Motilibacter peucedani]|uniref:Catechol-2,3-dioxygenase n=1 Tax=Motilibacter peucedani TaxID=598650 RepID=A0A420XTM1_9ACTN|nr:VOC family protein [Motilibacter peucedani]RKS80183.1 catechol-2,3-dioxygenase [Motilibacter peucedani]
MPSLVRPPAQPLRTVRLGCADLDRSLDFYTQALGFSEVARPSPGTRAVTDGATTLELVHVSGGSLGGWRNDDLQGGIRHVGLKVPDVDDRISALAARGTTVLSPPADVLGDVRIAFFLDPDGARLEFVQGSLTYQSVASPELAAAERAAEPSSGAPARVDHVAVTVPDLDQALRFYCDGLGWQEIGRIRHEGDERGFLMTYLQAGPTVLEVFSFDVPTAPPPARPDPALLGIQGGVIDELPERQLEVLTELGARRVDSSGTTVVVAPDGLPLEIGAGS